MRIIGAEGLTPERLNEELQHGAKFVLYQYCFSVLVMTFRRSSEVYYIAPGRSRITPGLGFSALSFVVGWWGFPWGIIYTIGSLITNFGGGKDVTEQIVAALNPAPATASAPTPPVGPQNPWRFDL